MASFLSTYDYRFILYRLASSRQPMAVSDALRQLAYLLESGVRPTNAQRARIVLEMNALTSNPAWSAYDTRLWYFISAAQLADLRLAPTLIRRAREEADIHLRVWGLLASARSASKKSEIEQAESSGGIHYGTIRAEAFALGREECSVFDLMLELLSTGKATVRSTVPQIRTLSTNDIELLLLAYGRGQLEFTEERVEQAFQAFIGSEGVIHDAALISEYSLWCARVRRLRTVRADWSILQEHPHLPIPRVRSAAYRLLGSKDKSTRDRNWDYLSDQIAGESDGCRFEIFSALSTRIGTYDSLQRTSDRKHLDAFIEWHMDETDPRSADRQFAFLVNNLEDKLTQEYVLEEVRASNQDRLENYIPIIRRSRRLPRRFLGELEGLGILSHQEQFDFAQPGLARGWNKVQISSSDGLSLEQVLERRFRVPELETVVIATANTREAKAVLSELRNRSDELGFEVRTETDDVLPFHEGRLKGKSGQRRAVVVRADDTGPLDATDLLRRIIDGFDAKYIFFVGCAALLDEKQTHKENTVFVARRAIDVDKREISNESASYDMDLAPGDVRVLRNVDALLDAGRFDPLNVVTNRYFLSGSAFIKSRESGERQAYVSDFPQDAVVLEMEAYAVLKAVQLRRAEGLDVAVSVIKGISDVGDENAQEGKDAAQRTATKNAMTVACALLRSL